MRLNQDCVRDILLELEEELKIDDHLFLQQLKVFDTFKKYGEGETVYALLKLIEGGYLTGKPVYGGGKLIELALSSITWDGHEFLSSVRSDKIWRMTKKRLSGIASASIGIITEVAKECIKQTVFGSE